MLFRLRAFAASCIERTSMNANLAEGLTVTIGLPGIVDSPTCSIARPRKSRNISAVISGVVLPIKSSRLSLSSPDSAMVTPVFSGTAAMPGGSGWPVSCCQVWDGTCGPEYLDGRATRKDDPRKGIPLRFNALLAKSTVASSMKQNLSFFRQVTMGVTSGGHKFTRDIAPERNCISRASEVPGGVFPTKSSRLSLVSGPLPPMKPTEEERGGTTPGTPLGTPDDDLPSSLLSLW
mmetsp:Transcript_36733/g.87750  ORF Transcript_36733/g.87750 Transcript_36733/m.87750 type:complete len:234 (+) Transcript_36733:597-1298(+)